MLLTNRQDITLAIDFGANAVHMVEVRRRGTKLQIGVVAEQSLSPGEAATLPERHLKALSSLLRLQRVKTRRAIAALPTSMVVTRTVNLDKVKDQTPDEFVRWTLQNCLPFDSRDLVFDYWPANAGTRPGGDVLVVAAPASVVERYLRGMEKLKLLCTHLDTAPCAIATLIARSVENADAMVGAVALSDRLGFFAIVERGKVAFWRPFELPHNQADAHERPRNTERIGDEISKCVSHMVGTMHVDNLNELLLYGYGVQELVGTDYLKNRFHLDVRAPSPFNALPPGSWPASLDGDQIQSATHYCTAVGLALQEAHGGVIHG